MSGATRLACLSAAVIAVLAPAATASATEVALHSNWYHGCVKGCEGMSVAANSGETNRHLALTYEEGTREYVLRADDPISYYRLGVTDGHHYPADECQLTTEAATEIRCDFGGPMDWSLRGSAGDDYLHAQVPGGVGLDGADGDDYMEGGGRQDSLSGGAGGDVLRGGGGDDRLVGGDGDDLLIGNRGDDELGSDSYGYGERGSNRFVGGAGSDVIRAVFRVGGGHSLPTTDERVSCGTGSDLAVIDRNADPRPSACERVVRCVTADPIASCASGHRPRHSKPR